MTRYRLTRRADADLVEIFRQSFRLFGPAQAELYIDGTKRCLDLLAGQPEIGRRADYIRPGLRRHKHGRHVILYRIIPEGIRVAAVPHQRQLPRL